MVGKYVKLNQRYKPHVSYPPLLGQMVEQFAVIYEKCLLVLASGFWQGFLAKKPAFSHVLLSPEEEALAKDVFLYCFRYFQRACNKTRQHIKLDLLSLTLFFLGAFFVDVGVSNHTEVDHIKGSEFFFKSAKKRNYESSWASATFPQRNWMISFFTMVQKTGLACSNVKRIFETI